jgi:hypothetical protein
MGGSAGVNYKLLNVVNAGNDWGMSASTLSERFACFELRPSSIVNAVDNRKIKGIEHAGM